MGLQAVLSRIETLQTISWCIKVHNQFEDRKKGVNLDKVFRKQQEEQKINSRFISGAYITGEKYKPTRLHCLTETVHPMRATEQLQCWKENQLHMSLLTDYAEFILSCQASEAKFALVFIIWTHAYSFLV